MAQSTTSVSIVVDRFRLEIERMGIRADRILLFGSNARGTSGEGSDIDLIVVSPDWSPYSQRTRLEMLGVAAARILEPVQAYGVTPAEIIEHRLPPFWEHVVRDLAVPVAAKTGL